MKRNITNCFIAIFALFAAVSCSDYLNQVPTNITTLEKIYETRGGVLDNLATVYSSMPYEFQDRWPASGGDNGTSGLWNASCDESEFVWDFNQSQIVKNGSVTSESDIIYQYWFRWYKGIRAATLFMKNIDICKVLYTGDREHWVAEARAARAIYYYYLFRVYGPVPILDEAVSEQSTLADFNTPRSSVEEMVKYILDELDWAINNGLQANIKQSASGDITSVEHGLGHIDQVIARAFKIQVRMLAASHLFNGSNSYFADVENLDGKKLFPAYNDTEKRQLWANAAAEAKSFINDYVGRGYDLTRVYTDGKLDPYLSYREAVRGFNSELRDFSGKTSAVEMIWFNKGGDSNTRHYNRTPKHMGGIDGYRCSGGEAATQESVDAYHMANGLKPITGYQSDGKTPIINTASGYTEDGFSDADYRDATGEVRAPRGVWKAWVNREPRFYADITFDGQKWLYDNGGRDPIYTGLQAHGNSGHMTGNSNDYSKTGYVVRKSAPTTAWGNNDRMSIMMRLAQIYLDYAEALNESNPGDSDILKYLNLIRERAGIPQFGSGAGMLPVPADMRQAIRDERRVELAFECCRYFDIRRWGIAENMVKAIHGLNIDKDGDEFFQRTKVKDIVFEKRNYFFPIPLKDMLINKNLVQNRGW